MKYIIEGADLPKVLKENRVRISRGTLKVTPVTEEVIEAPKEAEVTDTKEVAPQADTKTPKKSKK